MGKSKIEWTDRVWNPVTGCTKISDGCKNCYAETMAKRFAGEKGWGTKEDPFAVRLHPDRLNEPLKWKKPSKIFVCSMGDLFHEDVPFEFIDKVFAVMALSPQHTFQVLTKRPERMKGYLADEMRQVNVASWFKGGEYYSHEVSPWPLPNVWLGVTAENQEQADKRIPILLQTPAAVRFVSIEPMVGGVNLKHLRNGDISTSALSGNQTNMSVVLPWSDTNKLDWVIVGGESGPGARPMHPDWVRSLRDQCKAANVPFMFKQWGEYAPKDVADSLVVSDEEAESGDLVWTIRSNHPQLCSCRKPSRNQAAIGWLHAIPKPDHLFDEETMVYKVGKKKAGSMIDGKSYKEFPKD